MPRPNLRLVWPPQPDPAAEPDGDHCERALAADGFRQVGMVEMRRLPADTLAVLAQVKRPDGSLTFWLKDLPKQQIASARRKDKTP